MLPLSRAEDKEHCEEYGRLLSADPSKVGRPLAAPRRCRRHRRTLLPRLLRFPRTQVTKRAKKRGLPQLGTLGAGNHYAEIQVVDEIFDKAAASRMGIEETGQVCIMIRSGA